MICAKNMLPAFLAGMAIAAIGKLAEQAWGVPAWAPFALVFVGGGVAFAFYVHTLTVREMQADKALSAQ
jgi:hypothetical protein